MHYDFSNVEGMQTGLEAMRPIVERLGGLERLSEYYYLLPTVIFRRDGYRIDERVRQHSLLALETSRQTDNQALLTRTHFGFGFVSFLLGDFATAIQYM